VVRHPAGGGGAIDLENQVVNAAAEIRTHHAFTLGRAQDDPDRLTHALLVLGVVEEAKFIECEGESPTNAEKWFRHKPS